MQNTVNIQEKLKLIFSKNITYYMEKSGKSRDDLVKALNVPYATVSGWIRGLNYPRMDKIEELANFLGISKSDLIEEHPFEPLKSYNETWEIRKELQRRPHLKVLFDMSKNASKEDVEKIIQTLEVFIQEKE